MSWSVNRNAARKQHSRAVRIGCVFANISRPREVSIEIFRWCVSGLTVNGGEVEDPIRFKRLELRRDAFSHVAGFEFYATGKSGFDRPYVGQDNSVEDPFLREAVCPLLANITGSTEN